jgi:hypothetical protein
MSTSFREPVGVPLVGAAIVAMFSAPLFFANSMNRTDEYD